MDESKLTPDVEVIDIVLKKAREHDLESEVVAFALMAMRRDPRLTIQEAIYIGFFEWIK